MNSTSLSKNTKGAGVACRARGTAGFSLVEVLVTIVVISTGLLGFAKLQAAALSNTQTARVRSLVALQASSLAAAMYANSRYWASTSAPASIAVQGGTVTDSSGVLSASANCISATCTPAQLAAHDMQAWAANLQAQFPTHAATVSCSVTAPQPPHCNIELSWSEKTVAINRSTSLAPAAMNATQRYNLYVEP